MNLNESVIKIRVELQNSKINKSGKNKHAGFTYYELADFLPKLNELMLAHGINDKISIKDGSASITLIKGEEREEYSIPFIMFETPLANSGKPMMQDIQYLGALNTYYKRYLYLNAFGITDGEVIDSIDNSSLTKHSTYGGMSEQQATDKATQDGLNKILGGLDKAENYPYKDKVINTILGMTNKNKWEDITFNGNLTYNKLITIVSQELEKEKALAKAGV